jgi:hypothetical protein
MRVSVGSRTAFAVIATGLVGIESGWDFFPSAQFDLFRHWNSVQLDYQL